MTSEQIAEFLNAGFVFKIVALICFTKIILRAIEVWSLPKDKPRDPTDNYKGPRFRG